MKVEWKSRDKEPMNNKNEGRGLAMLPHIPSACPPDPSFRSFRCIFWSVEEPGYTKSCKKANIDISIYHISYQAKILWNVDIFPPDIDGIISPSFLSSYITLIAASYFFFEGHYRCERGNVLFDITILRCLTYTVRHVSSEYAHQ